MPALFRIILSAFTEFLDFGGGMPIDFVLDFLFFLVVRNGIRVFGSAKVAIAAVYNLSL